MEAASCGVLATCAKSPAPCPPGTVTPVPGETRRGPGYLPALMASRTSRSHSSGSPAPRTVVTPLASCCWALLLRIRRTMARPTGLSSFFIRLPASPAETGLPDPHRCTCMLMRPGSR